MWTRIWPAHPFTGTGLHLMMQDDPCDYQNGNAFQGGADKELISKSEYVMVRPKFITGVTWQSI